MKIKKRYIPLIVVLLIPAFWWGYKNFIWKSPLEAISGKWESTLQDHLANADHLEIINRVDDESITILSVNVINRLVSLIEIDEENTHSTYMCPSTKHFVFRKGADELATIYYLPESCCPSGEDEPIRLYWIHGKWPHVHAALTPKSADLFLDWLKENKIANHGMHSVPEKAAKID
jgi:hypothetical protein